MDKEMNHKISIQINFEIKANVLKEGYFFVENHQFNDQDSFWCWSNLTFNLKDLNYSMVKISFVCVGLQDSVLALELL